MSDVLESLQRKARDHARTPVQVSTSPGLSHPSRVLFHVNPLELNLKYVYLHPYA